MDSIKNAVFAVMKNIAAQNGPNSDADPERWLKKVLTKKELEHIKFNYFKNGVLSLNVDSSTWLYNFSLHKQKILEKFQHKFSQAKDIRFRIGEVKR